MVDPSERLRVLFRQEATAYRTTEYLSRMQKAVLDSSATSEGSSGGNASSPESPKKKQKALDELNEGNISRPRVDWRENNSVINEHWREKISEWCYQVVDHFDVRREIVGIAMNLLDRTLATFSTTVDKNLFQLVSMTCLYMAVKLNEYKHLLIPGSKSSMDTILQLSRGYFKIEQMEAMERDILQRLQWHVHPPTPQIFVKHFLFFLSIHEHEVYDLAQFLLELSVMDYFFVSFKPSEIATASTLIANEQILRRTEWDMPFFSTLVNIHSPEVQACKQRLLHILAEAQQQSIGAGTPPSSVQTKRTTSPVSVMNSPVECSEENLREIASNNEGL